MVVVRQFPYSIHLTVLDTRYDLMKGIHTWKGKMHTKDIRNVGFPTNQLNVLTFKVYQKQVSEWL